MIGNIPMRKKTGKTTREGRQQEVKEEKKKKTRVRGERKE